MIDKAKSSQSLRKVRRNVKPQNQESQRAQSPWRVISVKSRIPRPKNPLISKHRSKETMPLWEIGTFPSLPPFFPFIGHLLPATWTASVSHSVFQLMHHPP